MAVRKNAPARKKAPPKKSAPRTAAPTAGVNDKSAAKPRVAASVKTKPAVKAKRAGRPAKPSSKVAVSAASSATKAAKPATKAAKPATKAAKPATKAAKPASAREALKVRAMKQAIERVIAPVESDTAVVAAYLRDLDHPFKAELEALRAIILGASSKISERIKWNAPSFYYKEDFATFDPRATEFAQLILLFPGGAGVPAKSTLLEGKAKDRREAKFHSLADVQTKKKALEKLVKDWVALRDTA